MTMHPLLSILAAVSMLALTGPFPAPLYAAPSSGGTAHRLEAPPPQAAVAPAGPLGPLALAPAKVYTASQVIFTDQRWAPPWMWSGVQISARVPAAAVDGPLVVKTEHGNSNDSPPFGVRSSAMPDESGAGTTWTSTVSGQIASNTTWSQNVLVTGDVTVISGVTLTISPGVTVFFAANSDDRAAGNWTDRSEIAVYGTLIAEGTSQMPIYFTSNAAAKAPGDWGAIVIHKNSTASSLANCVIRYAEYGVGFLTYDEGNATLSASIRNSVVSHNTIGIRMSGSPDYRNGGTVTISATVVGNRIADNVNQGLRIETYTAYGTANDYSVVRDNVIEGNDVGLSVECSSWWAGHADNYPRIVNNAIRNNMNYGIYLLAHGSWDGTGADTDLSPTIEHNLLDNNGHDLYVLLEQPGASATQNYVHPAIRYNTIRDATNGITIDDSQARGVISPTIAYNVFYDLGEGGGYAINNVTTRTITLGENYWGSSPAEWDAGPQPGDTYGNVVVNGHLTSSSAPILTCVEPAAAQPGEAVTLHGANFWPPPPKVALPILFQYPHIDYELLFHVALPLLLTNTD